MATTIKNSTISALNDLLKRNYDAAKGYADAGNGVNPVNLREWFFAYSDQRERFAKEIEAEITKLGGEPNDGTSFLGELHRAWLDLKSDFFQNDIEATINECIRGEEYAQEDYQDILKDEKMTVSARDMLPRHLTRIRTAISELRTLKPQLADA